MTTTLHYTTKAGEPRVYTYGRTGALAACRTALRSSVLRRVESHWMLEHPFRRSRLFSSVTVNALVAAGEAVIIGDRAMARRIA